MEASVWYAAEKHGIPWLKTSFVDDKGSVEAVPGGMCFDGQKSRIVMARITHVAIVWRILPLQAIICLAGGNILVLFMAYVGSFQYITLENLLIYVYLVCFDLFAISVWPWTWVRVDFMGKDGEPGRGYFTMAAFLGRWKGGTRRLCTFFKRQAGMEG
jgi:hypothetical protein